jgi:hypothetical protein
LRDREACRQSYYYFGANIRDYLNQRSEYIQKGIAKIEGGQAGSDGAGAQLGVGVGGLKPSIPAEGSRS